MISGIHFLDIQGKALLSRDYRGDVSKAALQKYVLGIPKSLHSLLNSAYTMGNCIPLKFPYFTDLL